MHLAFCVSIGHFLMHDARTCRHPLDITSAKCSSVPKAIVMIDTTNRDKVEDVAQLYKEMFDQEAVGLYITQPMEFI